MANVGRPPKFNSPEELQEKIEAYFLECKDKKKMASKAGLAIYLDTTRETLGDYEKKEGYSDAIKRAYALIEEDWIQNLPHKNSATGSIFYLKAAFGFRDRVDLTTNEKDLPTPILPLDELRSNHSDEETSETEEED